MTTTTRSELSVSSPGAAQAPATGGRLGPLDVLVLSLWCGPAAGLIEVGAKVVYRSINPTGRLYLMSRHFVWLAPLSYLLLFSAVGVFLTLVTMCWPRRAGWLSSRVLCALTILPLLIVTYPQIYTWAWSILSLGIACVLVPRLERHATGLRWSLLKTLPCLLALVLVLAGFTFGRDWLKE